MSASCPALDRPVHVVNVGVVLVLAIGVPEVALRLRQGCAVEGGRVVTGLGPRLVPAVTTAAAVMPISHAIEVQADVLGRGNRLGIAVRLDDAHLGDASIIVVL